MYARGISIAVLFALAMASAFPVAADETQERALAKARYMLRQLNSQNQQMKAEMTRMQQELDQTKLDLEDSQKTVADLEKTLDKAQTRGDRLEQGLAVSEHQKQQAYERIRLLTDKLQEHIRVLKRTVAQRNQLAVENQEQSGQLQDCEFKNGKLAEANLQLTELYENKGTVDEVLQQEVITGLKQAQIEGIVEEYRKRVNDLQVSVSQGD